MMTEETTATEEMMTEEMTVAEEIMTEETTTEEMTAAEEMMTEETTAAEEMTTEETTVAEEIMIEETTAAEEIMTEEITDLQFRHLRHRHRSRREVTRAKARMSIRKKITAVMKKKECQRITRSQCRNHSRRSRNRKKRLSLS